VILSEPQNDIAFNYRGEVNHCLEKYEEAISDFDRAIQINNKEHKYFFNRAESKFRLQNYDQAILDYGKSLQIDSSQHLFFFKRGETYFIQ
jgi:tetratricopeptide (TPR) repeat protein